MEVLLIESDSRVLIDEKLREVIPENAEKITYSYPETSIEEILQEATFVAMFQEEKYVVVRNACFFGKTKLSDKESKILTEYFMYPNPETTLIFITYEPADKRKGITSLLVDSNNYVSLYAPKNYELLQTITKKMARYQVKEETVKYIIEACLNNYDIIMNEIDKLSLYYKDKDFLPLEEIRKIIPSNINENVFKFVDAVVAKDAFTAIRLFEDFLTIKTDPINLIHLVGREYRHMYYYKLFESKYYSAKSIASELKLADWQVKKLQKEASQYHVDDLKEILVSLSKLDYQIKSGNQDKTVAFYAFLVKTFEY